MTHLFEYNPLYYPVIASYGERITDREAQPSLAKSEKTLTAKNSRKLAIPRYASLMIEPDKK